MIQSSMKNVQRSWSARIGTGTAVIIIIVILIAIYAIENFRGMSNIVRDTDQTEVRLIDTAANLEYYQLEQNLYLERIFRFSAEQDGDIPEEIQSLSAAIRKLGNDFQKEIERGMVISEKAMDKSDEAAEKYMNINTMLTSLQDVHQHYDTRVRGLIALLPAGNYREARDYLDRNDENAQMILTNIKQLKGELKASIGQAVTTADSYAGTASKNHLLLSAAGIAATILFGLHVLKFILRYIADLKQSEDELLRHQDELEKLVEERSQELIREKDQLDFLIENMPDRIYFKDMEGRFIRVNKMVAKRFGFDDPKQMIGKSDFDFYNKEQAQEWQIIEQNIIRYGEAIIGVESQEVWQDGRETWASITKMPLRDHEGTIIGIFGITRDITARKQVEIRLQRIVEGRGHLDR